MSAPTHTPGWLVALSVGVTMFGLLTAWISMPWQFACFTTLVAWMAFGAGSDGTHWYRDNHHD